MFFRLNTRLQSANGGSALVIALIVLAILGALGVASLDVTDMNILISANDRDSKNAFFYADSGVNIAHVFLEHSEADVNATNSTSTPVWRNETVSQFDSTNSTISLYISGTKGTHIRFGILGVGREPGFEIGKYADYTSFLIRSHTNWQRNSRAEIDLGWKHFPLSVGYE